MARHALVIGIGRYPRSDWDLPAAVPDALRFTDWAVRHGGVDPANVRLLLSPWPGKATGHEKRDADRRSIVTAIQELQAGAADDGERLYFYYAGHGVSAPGVTTGGIQEPVIIPADVTSLRIDASLLIGFSEIMPALLPKGPREQFFFIDACRDFALEDEFQPGIGRSGIRWSPPNPDAGPRSAQYVLYSTSPGLQAYEKDATARGVFADALLKALSGTPKATQWSSVNRHYAVRWSTLVDYVRDTVAERVRVPPTAVRPAANPQLPERTTQGGTGDPFLRIVHEHEMAKLDLLVRVRPSGARRSAVVKVLFYGPGGHELPVESTGPPLQPSSTFSLAPGDYAVEATAERYLPRRSTCRLWAPCVEELRLEAGDSAVPAPSPAVPTGNVHVCGDPGALLAVWDSEGRMMASGPHEVYATLAPGIYRVRMILAEGGSEDRTVEVRAGGSVKVDFVGGAPDMGATQLAMLEGLDIQPGPAGDLHPSERLGAFSRAKLASLLGMAAFAGTGPFRSQFNRLRRFEIEPVEDAPYGFSPVLVLVGSSGEQPLPGVDVGRLLGEAELVVLRRDGDPVDQGRFTVLAGFASAAQRTFLAPYGVVTLELRLPGAGVTRYAIASLPDRRSAIVVVAEGGGAFDVQQFSIPLHHDTPGAPALLSDLTTLRRLETAQRYYAAPGDDELRRHLTDIVPGSVLDPLLGAMIGYSLVAQGREAAFREPRPGAPPDGLEASDMRNMLKFFPTMPDSHVLAGLCDPARRGEHFRRAVDAGLPVFSEGLRALHRWFREIGEVPGVLVEPSRRLVPGSPWTAWVATRPALLVQNGRFEPAPLGWHALERHRSDIETMCSAVGRVEFVGSSFPFAGTAFLVAPGIALTADHVMSAAFEARGGRWVARGGIGMRIDFAEEVGGTEPREYGVSGVVRTDGRLALLAVEPRSRPLPAPVRLAAGAPSGTDGRAVYIVGYPAVDDPRVPAGVARPVFGDASGVKRVQPGYVLAIGPDGKIIHDCFTLGGNAGSPLVDLESGLVLGLHHSGRWTEYKTGDAQALWDLSEKPLFRGIDVDWA